VSNHDEHCGGWRIVFRHPRTLAGTFLVGGILAFGYSYAPLHSAKDWKIDYQESRLESQRKKLDAFEAKLAAAEAEAAQATLLEQRAPRPQEFEEAQAKLAALEANLADLEKQKGKLTRSRDTWRSRHAAAEEERDEWKAQATGLETELASVAPETSAHEAAAPETATPSTAADTGQPVEDTVLVGARWTSPDGNASFTLVEAGSNRATLELDSDGGTVRVEAGSNIRIGDPARGSYRVTLMEIEAGRAVGISAVPEASDLLLAPLGGAAAPAPR
jgi:hypothetical protein